MAFDFKNDEVRLLIPFVDLIDGGFNKPTARGALRRAVEIAAELKCNLVIEPEWPLREFSRAIPGSSILGYSPAQARRRQTVSA